MVSVYTWCPSGGTRNIYPTSRTLAVTGFREGLQAAGHGQDLGAQAQTDDRDRPAEPTHVVRIKLLHHVKKGVLDASISASKGVDYMSG